MLESRALATTVVGSYSVPEWLGRLKTDYYQRRISAQHLNEIHDVAIKAAVKDQELAGVDIVSDGELRRDNDIDYLLTRIPGVQIPHRSKTDYYDYYEAQVTAPLPEARCPRNPECWNGLVDTSGDVTASSLPCTGPHVWQTFAIALLPADAQTYDVNIVQAVASVRAVCSKSVLLRSRLGAARRIPRTNWTISVMPPDQAAFNSGARAYRCLAGKIRGADPRTSQFGP